MCLCYEVSSRIDVDPDWSFAVAKKPSLTTAAKSARDVAAKHQGYLAVDSYVALAKSQNDLGTYFQGIDTDLDSMIKGPMVMGGDIGHVTFEDK
jgi:hypothetical protein